MKKLLLIGLGVAAISVGTMSLFNSETEFAKYHADIDGVDEMNFTSNPPVGKTGAPFESSCTDCHAGSTLPAAGTVDFTLGGLGAGYYPNTLYPVTIGATSGTKNGFQVVCVDDSDVQAGTFEAGTNSNISSASGLDYVRHTNAVGATTWSFNWTSPASATGDITFYYSYNISDDGGTTASDEIYVGSFTIALANDVGISEHEELEAQYNLSYSAETGMVQARYFNPDNDHVLFVVQNISGKEVGRYDLGYQEPGDHVQSFMIDEADADGIYLVSVFLGNRVLTKKLYVGN